MKVTFVCKCESYLQAATLEEFLAKEGIKYEERINDGATVHRVNGAHVPTKKRITRIRLTGESFAHIRNCIKQHPNWTDPRIKEHFKLENSTQTINKVRNGYYDERFISKHAKR